MSARQVCPGSGTRVKCGGVPGEEERCRVCERWVVVRLDGTYRRHAGRVSA